MTVVVGYTDRPESQAALRRAVDEARLREATLHIVQIAADTTSESPQRAQRWADQQRELRNRGAALEAKLRDGGSDAHFQLLTDATGPPSSAMLGVARQLGADLIVIGLRRRSPVGKLVLGSMAQDVVLGADCAVLAVKAQDDD